MRSALHHSNLLLALASSAASARLSPRAISRCRREGRDAVCYYLFPERFRNGDKANDPVVGSDKSPNNDFRGGDLQGIIEKLEYIRDLGADTICATNNAVTDKVVHIRLPEGASAHYVEALTGKRIASRSGHLTLTVPAMYGAVYLTSK